MAKQRKDAEYIRTITTTRVFSAWILCGETQGMNPTSHASSQTCHVIATGAPWCDDCTIASKIAARTGLWAYEHIRKRNTYRRNTREFAYRLVKTANLQLVKQQDICRFPGGLFSEFICTFFDEFSAWIIAVGRVRAYRIHAEGRIEMIASSDSDAVLGVTRNIPAYTFGKTVFEREDTLVVTVEYNLDQHGDTVLLLLSRTQPSSAEELRVLSQSIVRANLSQGTHMGMLVIRKTRTIIPTLEIT